MEFVRVISNLYTYKASECKRAITRLHCATSKSSLWNMGNVSHGGAFECLRIYRTNTQHVYTCSLDFQAFPLECITQYGSTVYIGVAMGGPVL